MTETERAWEGLRSRLLTRLEQDLRRGLVDEDIADLLLHLNSHTCVVTSSSCSGRIVVVGAPLPGDKKHGGIVARWHRKVRVEELAEALRRALELHPQGFVWVSAQPVMLTLYVKGVHVLSALLRAAETAGFKYSCAKPREDLGVDVFYVIILGTERVDVPIAFRGVKLVKDEHLSILAEMLNTYLALTKGKLERLKRALVATNLRTLCAYDEATLRGASMKSSDLSEARSCTSGLF